MGDSDADADKGDTPYGSFAQKKAGMAETKRAARELAVTEPAGPEPAVPKPAEMMRVLVYKRTHTGDPNAEGCFGANDCMGAQRAREFDAVVGVGGIGQDAVSFGIDRKINWIGIGPRKYSSSTKRGPEVLFDQFLDYGTKGPDFSAKAPQLAVRMYNNNVRSIFNGRGMSDAEKAEVAGIVRLADKALPSPVCAPRCPAVRPMRRVMAAARLSQAPPARAAPAALAAPAAPAALAAPLRLPLAKGDEFAGSLQPPPPLQPRRGCR
ncbi:hypothetical protein T492DRAFT_1021771 [Pavlovales sp. CCMP2436]|nr:hypothetical protein T492DRAFT_1021771 [Pavlovales sp. CCMP2436]